MGDILERVRRYASLPDDIMIMGDLSTGDLKAVVGMVDEQAEALRKLHTGEVCQLPQSDEHAAMMVQLGEMRLNVNKPKVYRIVQSNHSLYPCDVVGDSGEVLHTGSEQRCLGWIEAKTSKVPS